MTQRYDANDERKILAEHPGCEKTARFSRWLLLFVLQASSASTIWAAQTSLTMSSDAGDYIGGGQQYSYTLADGSFAAVRNFAGGVSISFNTPMFSHFWYLDFAAPLSQPLAPGSYPGAIRYPFQDPSQAGLSVYGDGRGCNTLTGSFEVREIVYGPGDAIGSFRATFEQHCEGLLPALRGEIRFNANVPVELTAPRNQSVLEGQELSFDVTAVALDGGHVTLSAAGLPAGASFTDRGDNTGQFVWTPAHDQIGIHNVMFSGADSQGDTESVSTAVTVGGIVRVPADQPSIQAAIDAATPGSQVLVGPGTYFERINFHGKAVGVASEEGPEATIIDGGNLGAVVTFESGEGPGSVISGFTLQHGSDSFGGGIKMLGSSPTIVGNTFLDNAQGGGGFGAAIGGNSSSAIIEQNVFRRNTCDDQFLSGVVSFVNTSSPRIANNLLLNNPCRAINMTLPEGNRPSVINNTIVGNRTGVRVDARVNAGLLVFSNNILFANDIGLQVDFGFGNNGPTWTHNLVFQNAIDYQGIADQTGTNGNISADPAFQCGPSGDYRLAAASPAVDVGDNSAPGLPDTDFAGRARVVDGDGDGTATVDMGALEFDPSVPAGVCVYVTCPDDVRVVAAPGQTSAIVSYPAPIGSPGATLSCAPPSGASFPGGTTPVSCMAMDAAGNSSSCSFLVTVIVPPPNDDFDYARVVAALPFTDSLDTRNATAANDDPSCAGQRATVWYAYTATEDTLVDASTYGSSYDATLSAYTGSRGALSQVSCGFGQIRFVARAGQTVFIMIAAFGSGGDLVFTMTGRPPLSVQVAIDPSGDVTTTTGVAVVRGTVTCSRGVSVNLSGELRQRFGRAIISGLFSLQVFCAGATRWEANVFSANGAFAGGRASASVFVNAYAPETGEVVFSQDSRDIILKGSRSAPGAAK